MQHTPPAEPALDTHLELPQARVGAHAHGAVHAGDGDAVARLGKVHQVLPRTSQSAQDKSVKTAGMVGGTEELSQQAERRGKMRCCLAAGLVRAGCPHSSPTWRANMDTVWGVSPSGISLGFSCIFISCLSRKMERLYTICIANLACRGVWTHDHATV